MSTALFVSPHLDDAVFSAGSEMDRLAREGIDVILLTVFTGSVAAPTGFALACQTDKGLAPDVDYMALRREEDRQAAAILRVAEVVHLGLLEAPHRGYESAPALFGGVHAGDDVAFALPRADRVYVPEGIGHHVDHLQVIAVAEAAATHRWRDLPYGIRAEAPPPHPDAKAIAPTPAKLDACAAYPSQLGFQFGGEEAMRAALAGVDEQIRTVRR